MPPATSSAASRCARAARGEVGERVGQRRQPEPLGVAHHGDDEPLEVEVDGDAEVDVRVHDQRVVADAGVDVRELGAARRSTARATNGR